MDVFVYVLVYLLLLICTNALRMIDGLFSMSTVHLVREKICRSCIVA